MFNLWDLHNRGKTKTMEFHQKKCDPDFNLVNKKMISWDVFIMKIVDVMAFHQEHVGMRTTIPGDILQCGVNHIIIIHD